MQQNARRSTISPFSGARKFPRRVGHNPEKTSRMTHPTPQPAGAGATDPWNGASDYIRVILRDIVTEAHVGLHPWERHPERPTRLVVNVEMFAALHGPAATTAQGLIDYDPIRDALKAWPSRPHTDLLETLVDELVGLCFRHPAVQACRVSVLKPDIFNEAAAAGVEVYRRREAAAAGSTVA